MYDLAKIIIIILNSIGNVERTDFVIKSSRDDADRLYDVITFGTVNKDAISDPSDVQCLLQVPKTNYTRRINASHYSKCP